MGHLPLIPSTLEEAKAGVPRQVYLAKQQKQTLVAKPLLFKLLVFSKVS